jgi:two-component system, OmpR family, response regulator
MHVIARSARLASTLQQRSAMRILFVEDHRVFAETVASQFLTSHHVDIVESVAAARLAAAAEPPYDVVLIDYDLPDGKGTEVVRHLRAARFRGRIVAVSSKDEGNQELRAAGAHAICKKAELHRIATVLQGLAPR